MWRQKALLIVLQVVALAPHGVRGNNWMNDFLSDLNFGNINNGDGNNNNNADFEDIDLNSVDAKLRAKMNYVLGLAGRRPAAGTSGGGGGSAQVYTGTMGDLFDAASPLPSNVDANTRLQQGRRVFGCMAAIGGFDEESLPKFASLRNMLYGELFDAYQTKENIDVVCKASQRRRNLGEQEQPKSQPMRMRGASPNKGPQKRARPHARPRAGRISRRLKAKANYPTEMSDPYNEWATDNVGPFTPSGDLTERPDYDMLVEDILEPLSISSTALNSLYIAEAAVDVVCNIVGIFEFGFDPGDFCRIISSGLGVAAFLQYFVVAKFEGDYGDWEFHTFLLNSAETEAIYANT